MKRPTTTPQMNAVSHLARSRGKAELSLGQAARKAGLTASLLRMLEGGCVCPTGGELEALALAYGTTIDDLQGRRPVQGTLMFGGSV